MWSKPQSCRRARRCAVSSRAQARPASEALTISYHLTESQNFEQKHHQTNPVYYMH